MKDVFEFFNKLFDSSDWPPRWHCGQWTQFHGWLYIISDLLIWSAYFTIPLVILKYIFKKQGLKFIRLYFLFATFILACGATHFLDAVAFWVPMYRLNALFRFITAVVSWVTVFYMAKYLPFLFSLKQQKELDAEIFQRKELEEKLSKVKNDFQLLVSSVKDYAILLLDTDGRVSSWNTGAEYIKGYAAAEIIGKPMDVFYTDEQRAEGEPQKNLRETLRYGHYETEGFRLRKDGSSFYANIVFTSLYNQDRKLYGFAEVTKDISEKRKVEEELKKFNKELIISRNKIEQSEERFRNVVEQAITPIFILKGEELKLELANEPIFKLWKVGKETIGKPFLEILPEMKGRPFVELLMDVLHNGTTHYGNEQPGYFIRENGEKETLYFNYVYLPYRENDKTISGVIIQATDVSAQVFARKKIETSETNLLVANKELSLRNIEIEKRAAELNMANSQLTETEAKLNKINTELEQRVKERTEDVIKSEKRFRSMIENNNDFINITDQNYKIIYRSPSAYRITGWTNEEILNAPPYKHLHPDDREKAQKIISDTLAAPGKPIYSLLRMLHKNGRYIWLEGVVTNLLHDVNINGFVSNYHDVTERVHAEEKLIESEKLYRSLFENMLNGFAYCKAIFDGDKLIDYLYIAVNDEYETLTGLKNIAGKKMSELMPDLLDSDPEYIEVMKKVLLEGKPEKYESYVAPLDKWFSISLYSPEKEYFVSLVDNITARKSIEQKIKKLNTELEEKVATRTEQLKKSNEELEAFTYSVSHDLRAPLRGIIGFTAILEEDYVSKLDKEAKRITGVIKNNTTKMGYLIDDLLAFSRMGKQEIMKTSINSNKMITEVLNELSMQYNTNNKVSWNIHELPLMNADRNTIRQVWINLISNAIKYSQNNNTPHIEIGSYPENGMTVFFVKDNGVGFDEKYYHKLFKVFQRLHSAEEFEGTGVGLALVEKIISKHGGRVWANAKENEGASFYFSLPA